VVFFLSPYQARKNSEDHIFFRHTLVVLCSFQVFFPFRRLFLVFETSQIEPLVSLPSSEFLFRAKTCVRLSRGEDFSKSIVLEASSPFARWESSILEEQLSLSILLGRRSFDVKAFAF